MAEDTEVEDTGNGKKSSFRKFGAAVLAAVVAAIVAMIADLVPASVNLVAAMFPKTHDVHVVIQNEQDDGPIDGARVSITYAGDQPVPSSQGEQTMGLTAKGSIVLHPKTKALSGYTLFVEHDRDGIKYTYNRGLELGSGAPINLKFPSDFSYKKPKRAANPVESSNILEQSGLGGSAAPVLPTDAVKEYQKQAERGFGGLAESMKGVADQIEQANEENFRE